MTSAITKLHSTSDREYLDQLFRCHYPMLVHLVASIIRDQDSVDDMVLSAIGLFRGKGL